MLALLYAGEDWKNDRLKPVIKLLAESGAYINARNQDGETPLGVAKREERDAAVKRLSELGGVE